MSSKKIDDLVEDLKNLNLLEASELVTKIMSKTEKDKKIINDFNNF